MTRACARLRPGPAVRGPGAMRVPSDRAAVLETPWRRKPLAIAAALAVALGVGFGCGTARAQEAAPLRYTVKTIDNDMGVRAILEFSRKPVYEIRNDGRKVLVMLKEPDAEA